MVWYESDVHSVETVLHILNFDLFPDERYEVWSSLVRLGRGAPQLPVQPGDHEGKQPIHLKSLFFTFHIVFNKLHERFNALLARKLCVR